MLLYTGRAVLCGPKLKQAAHSSWPARIPTRCSAWCGRALCMSAPSPERHRMIFYLGHLEAFDWNLIARYALDVPAFHPEFDRLFAFGIDPASRRIAQRPAGATGPSLAEVRALRQQRTREKYRPPGGRGSRTTPARRDRASPDARRNLRLHPASAPYEQKVAPKQGWPAAARRSAHPAQSLHRDSRTGGRAWGWTQRKASAGTTNSRRTAWKCRHSRLAQYKVTNGEYLEFVGRAPRRRSSGAATAERRTFRGMFEEYPLPLDAPVYVHPRRGDRLCGVARHATAHRGGISIARAAGAPRIEQCEFPLLGSDCR